MSSKTSRILHNPYYTKFLEGFLNTTTFRSYLSHDKDKALKPQIQTILRQEHIHTLAVTINLAERGNSADTTAGNLRVWLFFPQVDLLANNQLFKCTPLAPQPSLVFRVHEEEIHGTVTVQVLCFAKTKGI